MFMTALLVCIPVCYVPSWDLRGEKSALDILELEFQV